MGNNYPKSFEEMDIELCDYCEFTRDGQPVNTGPWNLCEGRRCPQAYERYLEEYEEDTDETE